jgi:cyclic pyranopterin phosphate synthase
MESLVDNFGRKLDYLRLSVTDRCNFRCGYCMPPEGVEYIEHGRILSYEELLHIARVADRLGMKRVRITGGEPLVRKGLVWFVSKLSSDLNNLEDLAMTTNGALLAPKAGELKEAGLDRVNISLDTLDPEVFRHITRCGSLEAVIEGIGAAVKAGLTPVKLNAVLLEGINDDLDSIKELLDFASRHGATLRFIELMPIGITDEDLQRRFVAAAVVAERMRQAGLLLEEDDQDIRGGGPAVYFKLAAGGRIGFITALTHGFCAECSRLRLTAEGKLFPCLASNEYIDLKEPLRDGARFDQLAELFREAARCKPEQHEFIDPERLMPGTEAARKRMSKLGG